MKLFKYLGKVSSKDCYSIFEVVQSLEPYAKVKYKSRYEDALDASYEHIIKNYDSTKGDLQNYATKVVGTIWLNSNKKEIADDEQTQYNLDSKAADGYSDYSVEGIVEEGLKSKDMDNCIKEMVKFFVKDFKLFTTLNIKLRKMDYSEFQDNYSTETILGAIRYLLDNYADDIEKFLEFSKSASIRNFDEDRYLRSIDPSLEYRGMLNDILILSRRQGSHVKKIYRVSVKDTVNSLIKLFYSDTNYGKMLIEGIPVYMTLSGKIVNTEEELRFFLEKELVGSLLSRTSLKVLLYEKGEEIFLSSTKDEQSDVVLPLFDKNVSIHFDRVVIKEV